MIKVCGGIAGLDLVLCAIVVVLSRVVDLSQLTSFDSQHRARKKGVVHYLHVIYLLTSYIHIAHSDNLTEKVVMPRGWWLLTSSPIGVRHAEVVILRQPSSTFPKRRMQRLS